MTGKSFKKLSDLLPDDKNANRGTKRGGEMLGKSLTEYGAGRSILIDKQGRVIAGNKTLASAKAAGLKDLLVVQTDGKKLIAVQRMDLDLKKDKRAKELAIADNRTGEINLEWDEECLKALKIEIELPKFFTETELHKLIGQEFVEAPEPQMDRAAELQQKWDTVRGQIWQIGRHRLMCGDSTSKDDVEALTSNEQIDAALTDPPYGVGLEYESTDDSEDNLRRLITGFMPLLLKKCTVVAVTSGHKNMWIYPRPTWTLCWFYGAGQFMSPWGFNCWQPILVYGKDPFLAHGEGGRPDAVDMNVPANKQDVDHPCPKPLGFWSWCMDRVLGETGKTVLDVFAGSGTSIIAAEQAGRICYGMEIEPKYVAVALERLSDMGLKPKLAKS